MAQDNLTSVTLQVNGQQAAQTIDSLRSRLDALHKQLNQAAAAGDKISVAKLRKEVAQTDKQLRAMETSTQSVERVLSRLDKASPRELQRTLKDLKRQLNDCERGTKAWADKARQLKQVEAEISRINTQLRATNSSQSGLQAFLSKTPFGKFTNLATAAAGAVAAIGVAAKKSFDAFVSLDAAMAETRKFTGLSRSEVRSLSREFSKLDTRTSVLQLHAFAQEAGRLGITGTQNLLGYVRAADQINVALSDLGEGATQTIAQLGDIFKITPNMGVEKAMLSIGSTVNVLSQNCAASKPEIVEFTTRLAGIGQQAGFSVDQIMAFGAALSKNKLNVEASASAVGQLLQKMYQDPARIATAAGLDIKKFTDLLHKDANAALIAFLERIRELGSEDGLAALAPLFKDAGTQGVRLSQTISTLANEIDFLKWEQGEANRAFSEAVSVGNEFMIFNETAEAKIEKSRKAWARLASTLGEKLAPALTKVAELFTFAVNKMFETEEDKAISDALEMPISMLLAEQSKWQKQVDVLAAKVEEVKSEYPDDYEDVKRYRDLNKALEERKRILAQISAILKQKIDERNAVEAAAFAGTNTTKQPEPAGTQSSPTYTPTARPSKSATPTVDPVAELRQRIADEKQCYQLALKNLELYYLTSQLTDEQYQTAKEDALLIHLQNLRDLYDSGSDEWLSAQLDYEVEAARIQKRRLENMQKTEAEGLEQVTTEIVDWGAYVSQQIKDALDEVSTYFDIFSGSLGNLVSQVSSYIDAETDLQTAQLNQRYEAALNAAEGNRARIVELERRKNEEIAAAENEASRKRFAMQVLTAVSDTAQGALRAYMSAMDLPTPINLIIGAIAAGIATATGAVQIATIKKQQQAALAQGYAEGGYTPKGGKYQPAGIVHAGEWVASQELVNSPAVAPIIARLDQMQRTNRIPAIPQYATGGYVNTTAGAPINIDTSYNEALIAVINTLAQRLDQPIVAQTTLLGDHGIRQAEERYSRLMRNKSK